MKRRVRILICLLVLLLALPGAVAHAQAGEADGPVLVMDTSGVVNPFTARYVRRVLRLAEERDARLVVIVLNTPGGLESSMREIVIALMDSPVPVAVHVGPSGARATSAGLFLVMAGHVASMAPGTHVGAAHPVVLDGQVDEVAQEKMVSDAAALIRSIATARGRNVEWAERAVRENLSLTAGEALDEGVIDLVSGDVDDLLAQVDGRTVQTAAGVATLAMTGAPVERVGMTFPEQLMHVISDPNIAYLLLSLAMLFVLAELADPGLSIAGVGAVVCFVLGFMALGNLPVNWAGIGLIALGVVLFGVGLFTDTEWAVTLAGLIPFILGSLILFVPFRATPPAAPVVRVSPWLIGAISLSVVVLSVGVLRAILRVRHLPPQSGAQRLIGYRGVAVTPVRPTGQVIVDRQTWSAVAASADIGQGQPVRVVGVTGVRLQVVPDETPDSEREEGFEEES